MRYIGPSKKMGTTDAYAMILAGGGGTRLWPASRRKRPKQLLTLGGVQREGDALFVAGDDLPPQPVTVLGGAVGAGRVTKILK